MLHTSGVLPMGEGDRGAEPAPAASTTAGLGGFDPSRYRMGLMGADVGRMAAAHRLAVEEIKSGPGSQRVGWTLALVDFQPAEGGEERFAEARPDRADGLAGRIEARTTSSACRPTRRNHIGPEGQVPPPEGVAVMQTGWEVYPAALGHTVRLAAEHARVPVLVTENGMATDDDEARQAYTCAAWKVWPDHRRRHRRPRLPALDPARQLRVDLGLLQDLRAVAVDPNLRPHRETLGPLARPGRPPERAGDLSMPGARFAEPRRSPPP